MIDLVSKEKAGIIQMYKSERGKVVPEDIQDDPFDIFTLYNSCVSKPPK